VDFKVKHGRHAAYPPSSVRARSVQKRH